jgi:hypothetical protein
VKAPEASVDLGFGLTALGVSPNGMLSVLGGRNGKLVILDSPAGVLRVSLLSKEF